MRLEIYKETEQEAVEIEPTVTLRLIQLAGVVQLIAVDENGKRISGGNILTITTNGTVHLCEGCAVKGIQTGNRGRIKCTPSQTSLTNPSKGG